MRVLSVQGYLGTDPEFKTTKNGSSYVTFRLASNEPKDKDANGNQITYWYTVFVWDSALQNFCKVLKKGSSVTVVGDPTDRVYTSQKTGLPEIGRDIKAAMIGFNQGGQRKEDNGEQEAGTSAPQAAQAPAQAKAQPQPQPTANATVPEPTIEFADAGEGADDLPF